MKKRRLILIMGVAVLYLVFQVANVPMEFQMFGYVGYMALGFVVIRSMKRKV